MSSQARITIDCPAGRIEGIADEHTQRFHSIDYSLIPGPFDDAAPRPPAEHIDATRPRPEAVALSITTPPDAQPLMDCPVVVFIHGGRYEVGSHVDYMTDGGPNAAAGIITVHIGYRVRLPGFMQFHDDAESHFRGIDDCQLALEWIQTNIESFGGDPTNVTLIGQSAGATSVLWLARKDHYRGTFRRAIAASPAFPRNSYRKRKWVLRETLGSLPLTRKHMHKAAFRQPRRIERGYKRFRTIFALDIALGPYPLDPKELADVPLIVTCTRDEFFTMPPVAKADARGLGGFVARLLARIMGVKRVSRWFTAARDMDPDHILGRLISDTSSRRWVSTTADESPHPVWMAEFVANTRPALHADELEPLFGIVDSPLHEWLIRYAHTGEPEWPDYHDQRQALRVWLDDARAELVTDPLGYIRESF